MDCQSVSWSSSSFAGGWASLSDAQSFASDPLDWLYDFGDDLPHGVLDGEDLVVEEGAVVLLDGPLGVAGVFEGDGGGAQELAELVPVKPASFQLADLGEQLLQVVVRDLLFVDVPDLESRVGWLKLLLLHDLLLRTCVSDAEGSLLLGGIEPLSCSLSQPSIVGARSPLLLAGCTVASSVASALAVVRRSPSPAPLLVLHQFDMKMSVSFLDSDAENLGSQRRNSIDVFNLEFRHQIIDQG